MSRGSGVSREHDRHWHFGIMTLWRHYTPAPNKTQGRGILPQSQDALQTSTSHTHKSPVNLSADRGLVLDIQVHLDVFPPMDAAGSAVRVKILLRVLPCHGEGGEFLETQFLPSFIAACAAARRAMGTRKGEQET